MMTGKSLRQLLNMKGTENTNIQVYKLKALTQMYPTYGGVRPLKCVQSIRNSVGYAKNAYENQVQTVRLTSGPTISFGSVIVAINWVSTSSGMSPTKNEKQKKHVHKNRVWLKSVFEYLHSQIFTMWKLVA